MSNVQADFGRHSCGGASLTEALSRLPTATRSRLASIDEPAEFNSLVSTIESAIIPRLLLNHGVRPAGHVERADAALETKAVERVVGLAMGPDSSELARYINEFVSRGVPKERVLMEIMAPAARLMGDMWTADLCSFVDVTLGLSRLHFALRDFNGLSEDEFSGRGVGGKVSVGARTRRAAHFRIACR